MGSLGTSHFTDEGAQVQVQKAQAQILSGLTPKFDVFFSLSQPHGLLF